jgi:ATP-dependent Zn protease
MDAKLGQVAYEPEPTSLLSMAPGADWHPRRYGEETAGAIDVAVRELLDDAFKRAVAILTANRTVLRESATELLEKETFSTEDIERLATKLLPLGSDHKRSSRHATLKLRVRDGDEGVSAAREAKGDGHPT